MSPAMPVVIAALLWGCAAYAVLTRTDSAERAKARYYYTAGEVEQARGNDAEAYEYFKRAYESDTTYAEAAMAYGMQRLYIPIDTLQTPTELNRSLAMMRKFVDEYPGDIHESQVYGFINGQVGNTAEAVRVLDRAYELHPQTSSILTQLSDVYAKAGNIDDAVEALNRYERQAGMSPTLTTRKVSLLLANKDTVGSLSEISRLVASDLTNSGYLILKGNVLDILQMPDSAVVYYNRAEQLDPESSGAKLALADYYRQTGDSVAYDNKMYEVMLCADLDLDQKVELVANYLQGLITNKQETKRGDHLFDVLRTQYPHEPRVLDLAARYSAAKQNYKEAEEEISYAIDRDPANVTYWGQLMTYQAAANEPERALETYEKAKQHIEPDNQLKLYYASVATTAKRYDLASQVYRQMIDEINPGLNVDSKIKLSDLRKSITMSQLSMLSSLVASLGDMCHEQGDTAKAYLMYENAITLDDTNNMARNNYAYFMSEDGGDLDKALEMSEKSLTGDDAENPTYLDTYAWINFLKGNYEKAEEMQIKAVEAQEKSNYKSPELYDHLGDIFEKKGDIEAAVEAWQKAAQIYVDNEETNEKDYKSILVKIEEAQKSMKKRKN